MVLLAIISSVPTFWAIIFWVILSLAPLSSVLLSWALTF